MKKIIAAVVVAAFAGISLNAAAAAPAHKTHAKTHHTQKATHAKTTHARKHHKKAA